MSNLQGAAASSSSKNSDVYFQDKPPLDVDTIVVYAGYYSSIQTGNGQIWWNREDLSAAFQNAILPGMGVPSVMVPHLAEKFVDAIFAGVGGSGIIGTNTLNAALSQFVGDDGLFHLDFNGDTDAMFEAFYEVQSRLSQVNAQQLDGFLPAENDSSDGVATNLTVRFLDLGVTAQLSFNSNDEEFAQEAIGVLKDLISSSPDFAESFKRSADWNGNIQLNFSRLPSTKPDGSPEDTIAWASFTSPPSVSFNLNLGYYFDTPEDIAHNFVHEFAHLDGGNRDIHGPEFSAYVVKVMHDYLDERGSASSHNIEYEDYSTDSLGPVDSLLNNETHLIDGLTLGQWFEEISALLNDGKFDEAAEALNVVLSSELIISWHDPTHGTSHSRPISQWFMGLMVYESFDTVIGGQDGNMDGDNDKQLTESLGEFYQYLSQTENNLLRLFNTAASRYGISFVTKTEEFELQKSTIEGQQLGPISSVLDNDAYKLEGLSFREWMNSIANNLVDQNFEEAFDQLNTILNSGLYFFWDEGSGNQKQLTAVDWITGFFVFESFDSHVGGSDGILNYDDDKALSQGLNAFRDFLFSNGHFNMLGSFERGASLFGLTFPLYVGD